MKKQKLNASLSLKKSSVSNLTNINGGAIPKTLDLIRCPYVPPATGVQNTCQFSCAHNDLPSCKWTQCCAQ